jgi:hypothetical protein
LRICTWQLLNKGYPPFIRLLEDSSKQALHFLLLCITRLLEYK